jgi:ABC-type phosphate transport system substrate-binding protein
MRPAPHLFALCRAVVIAGAWFGLGGGIAVAADVVAVVSVKSPVAVLTKAQVADIFLGKADHYPDGSRAVPIDMAEGSPARDDFYIKYAGKSPAQVKAHWSKIIFTGRGRPPVEAANPAELKKRLAENTGAIGYIEPSRVDVTLKPVAD